jgi:hypothetical protein
MKKIVIFIFTFIIVSHVSAQRINLMGRVQDSATGLPLKDVAVTAFSIKDTSLLNFSFTTKNGNYCMEVNGQDSILVTFSYFAYKEQHVIWKATERYYTRTNIQLVPDPKWKTLSKVKLKTSPISMRGDTIEIIASRFKVLPGSDVAQLFKKIPGFEVDVSGTVKVNGKDINKIMVDGSDFFGNNPALVSKTLQADMIEKVQVYEEKDENGEIVQDGEVLINLKLKKGANNGYFGDAIFGAGTDELFEAGLRFNSFKEDRKLSIIANANNANNSGFDFGFNSWHGWVNNKGVGQTWDDKAWENGAYNIPEQGNINNVGNYGISYFNEVRPNVKVSGNVVYSNKIYDNENYSLVENFITDTSSRTVENNNTSRGMMNQLSYRAALSDYSDSMFWYEISVKGKQQDGLRRQVETNEIEINDISVNSASMIALSEQAIQQGLVSLDVGGRMSKVPNRPQWGIDLIVGAESENTVLNRYNNSSTDSFNIKNNRLNQNQYIRFEPNIFIPIIPKRFSARFKGEFYRQDNDFSGIGFNSNILNSTFEQPYLNVVDTLSADMKNIINTNTLNADLSYYNDKVYISAEITYLNASIKGAADLLNQNVNIDNQYNAWLPELYFSYGRRTKTRHSFYYSTRYSLPQGSDILPAYNVFNIWNRAVGNPVLGLTINSSLDYWMRKQFTKGIFRTLNANANYSWSDNYKVSSTFTNESGLAETRPVLLGGYVNTSASIRTNIKLYKKLLSLQVNANGYQREVPLLFNNQQFLNTNSNFGGGTGLNINYSDSLSFYLGYNASQFNNSNNRSESLNFEQFIQGVNGRMRAVTPWGTMVNVNFNLDDQRAVPGIGKFIPLLNVYLQHPLIKSRALDIKLSAFDLFNQNVGISRTVSQGFNSISQRNLLQRYFMLTLVYKVKNMGRETRRNVW